MKRLRECSICQVRLSEHLCRKCGAAVCINHYDYHTGLCENCRLGPSAKKPQESLKK